MKIVIFGKADCPWCEKAKDFLASRNLPFEYYDIYDNWETYGFLAKKHDYKKVPMVFIDHRFIGGFNDLTKELDPE